MYAVCFRSPISVGYSQRKISNLSLEFSIFTFIFKSLVQFIFIGQLSLQCLKTRLLVCQIWKKSIETINKIHFILWLR